MEECGQEEVIEILPPVISLRFLNPLLSLSLSPLSIFIFALFIGSTLILLDFFHI